MENIFGIFTMDIKKEYQDDFYKEILISNNLRCQIVLVILCILMVPYIIIGFSKPNTDYYLSMFAFVLEIIGLFSLFIYKNKRYVCVIHISIIVLCLIWSQYVNYYNEKYMGDFTPYLIGLLGLSSMAYLKPKYSIILFAINHLIFLMLSTTLINDNSILLNISVNATIGAIFACIVAILNYRYRLNSFLNKKLIEELNFANQKLEESVRRDVGTGIRNRLSFNEKLEAEWKSVKHSRGYLSLIMLDIDFFKQYNDTYGHSTGDICLKDVAQCISNAIRTNDFVGRYGGEEFVVLLPHKGRKDGTSILTISLGVASIVPNNENTSIQLIECADSALYDAKARGRNKVMAY